MQNTIFLKTNVFDLDWNRHVTSRTYERFSLQGRHSILNEIGYPIQKCIEENLLLIPEFTQVRFLAQQFAEANLKVQTQATSNQEGKILWTHKIFGEDEALACELTIITLVENKNGKIILPIDKKEEFQIPEQLRKFSGQGKRLIHDYKLLQCELNCFHQYSPDIVWKAFEEGRWFFFGEIIDITRISSLDTTCFFMGGKIQFFRLPLSGEKVKLYTWVESVEKIRFYIRQDLVGENGDLIASMRDEQLFVSISTSRPRKAPTEFFEIVKDYIELPNAESKKN